MISRRSFLKTTTAALYIPATRAKAEASISSLNQLLDSFAQEYLDTSPMLVSSLGMDKGARKYQKYLMDDLSPASLDRTKSMYRDQKDRLAKISRESLKEKDKISFDVISYNIASNIDASQFDYGAGSAGQPYIISQLTGIYSQGPSFLDTQHSIETEADADAYLARLSGLSRLMDQEVEMQKKDAAQGIFAPDFALQKTLLQMKALRQPNAENSTLTSSLQKKISDKKISGNWGNWASRIVEKAIYPSLEKQIELVDDLLIKSDHNAGVWRLPRGKDYYQVSLKQWATTVKSPEEIHQIGLDVVRDHGAKIDVALKKIGLSKGSVGSRLEGLYSDKKYQYANTDEAKKDIITELNLRVKSIREKLGDAFNIKPKAELKIQRVPQNIEAAQPGGYYNNASLDGTRPGIYWINLRDTAEVPKWTLPTLTYHEGIPGHHLQLSIQQEVDMPLARKLAFFSAYIEGWALYAEQLAAEMGVYDHDKLAEIGQLQAAMFRGVRLVVDTGMHEFKWSRERALQYYVETLGEKEASAITEIERYCVWPGQACSYMLGKLAILDARNRARYKLGSKFDIRDFHDAILSAGALPLDLIDEIVDSYVTDRIFKVKSG